MVGVFATGIYGKVDYWLLLFVTHFNRCGSLSHKHKHSFRWPKKDLLSFSYNHTDIFAHQHPSTIFCCAPASIPDKQAWFTWSWSHVFSCLFMISSLFIPSLCYLEMGPDPTQVYFWPAVNKRPTYLRPGYFLTQPKEIFWTQREKDRKN